MVEEFLGGYLYTVWLCLLKQDLRKSKAARK